MIYEKFFENIDTMSKKEIFNGENYDIINTLMTSKTNPSFFKDLQNFLEKHNPPYFNQPQKTSMKIVDNIKKYVQPKTLLAYYTSVNTAYELISKKEFWLRRTVFMNDYNEILFGKEKVIPAIDDLRDLLDDCCLILNCNIKNFYSTYVENIENIIDNTYIMCLCEHDNDDDLGKLSMWRSYGSKGVSLIFKKKAIEYLMNDISMNISGNDKHKKDICAIKPVIYTKESGENIFKEAFRKTLEYIKNKNNKNNSFSLMSGIVPDAYLDELYICIAMGILLTKNSIFKEEAERRLIISLGSGKDISNFPMINKSLETIENEKQFVYKINFGDILECKDYKLSLNDLLDKILIWSDINNNAKMTKEIFEDLLNKEGYDVKNKIKIVNIPLRRKK